MLHTLCCMPSAFSSCCLQINGPICKWTGRACSHACMQLALHLCCSLSNEQVCCLSLHCWLTIDLIAADAELPLDIPENRRPHAACSSSALESIWQRPALSQKKLQQGMYAVIILPVYAHDPCSAFRFACTAFWKQFCACAVLIFPAGGGH